MDIFQSIIAARLIFIFAVINLVTGALVLLSCRCIPTSKITASLMKYRTYQHFYRYHCYIWWVFWVSVIAHAVFAGMFFGIAF
jgi:hypothetical protein